MLPIDRTLNGQTPQALASDASQLGQTGAQQMAGMLRANASSAAAWGGAPTGPVQATGMPGIVRQGNSFSNGIAPNPYPASQGWHQVPGAGGVPMETRTLPGYGPQNPAEAANTLLAVQASAAETAMNRSLQPAPLPQAPATPPAIPAFAPSALAPTPAPTHGIGFDIGDALHQGLQSVGSGISQGVNYAQNAVGDQWTDGIGSPAPAQSFAGSSLPQGIDVFNNALRGYGTMRSNMAAQSNSASDALMKQLQGFGTGLGKGWNAQ